MLDPHDLNEARQGRASATDDANAMPSRRWRFVFSWLIIGHLMAVFLPPLAFQTRGPRGVSPSVMTMLTPVQRYAEFAYLDRGYAFFAPDPGPSHLVRVDPIYDGEVDTDSAVVFPDLDALQPRLRYHRYFMISEFMHEGHQPALPADAAKWVGPELPAEELQVWRTTRQRYEAITDSIAKHYRQRLGADDVQLSRIEHRLPDFVGFVDSKTSLTDQASYIVLPDEPIPMDALLGEPTMLPTPMMVEPVPTPDAKSDLVPDETETSLDGPPSKTNAVTTDADVGVSP